MCCRNVVGDVDSRDSGILRRCDRLTWCAHDTVGPRRQNRSALIVSSVPERAPSRVLRFDHRCAADRDGLLADVSASFALEHEAFGGVSDASIA